MAGIVARYPGTCQTCGKQFAPGERIVAALRALRSRSGWAHEACGSSLAGTLVRGEGDEERHAHEAWALDVVERAWRDPTRTSIGEVEQIARDVSVRWYRLRLPDGITRAELEQALTPIVERMGDTIWNVGSHHDGWAVAVRSREQW